MNHDEIREQVEAQRRYFREGHTRPIAYRKAALRRLREGILALEPEIHAALYKDLGKSPEEAFLCETGMALSELGFLLRHVSSYAKARGVPTSLAQFPAKCQKVPTPYGTALILSPWNYPFLLALAPAIDAIAAGNTVVIKPSEYAPYTAQVLKKLVSCYLPPELALVILGDHRESQALLDCPFDHIFYTGGAQVGRLVMEKAAAGLTPVTLELGGKSPCIVDESANLALAARRIVFGKFLNCGQTCVAPDYLLVQEGACKALIAAIKKEIRQQLGENPLENEGYGKIINRKHFDRLLGLIQQEKLILGGNAKEDTLQIAPTLLYPVSPSDPVMEEEIFGPILPILTYGHLEEAMAEISSRPHPLALYLFSENKRVQRLVMELLSFGGGCINDTVLHLASSHMGFGGIGESGMGSYHGKAGFDAFSHYKSVLKQSTRLDLPLRYPPYTKGKLRLARRFLR